MSTPKVTHIVSTAVPLPVENIDTDQIAPARFLKSTSRTGFEKVLFYDWRYDTDGNQKSDFVLNDPAYKGEILIAGRNFGCGSSREHAAWALKQYGFKAVVSSFFADIFKSNALNNSLLPVLVSQEMLDGLLRTVQDSPDTEITIDIANQTIHHGTSTESFEISAYKKLCIMNEYDDVDYLLQFKDKVEAFEKNRTNDWSGYRE